MKPYEVMIATTTYKKMEEMFLSGKYTAFISESTGWLYFWSDAFKSLAYKADCVGFVLQSIHPDDRVKGEYFETMEMALNKVCLKVKESMVISSPHSDEGRDDGKLKDGYHDVFITEAWTYWGKQELPSSPKRPSWGGIVIKHDNGDTQEIQEWRGVSKMLGKIGYAYPPFACEYKVNKHATIKVDCGLVVEINLKGI